MKLILASASATRQRLCANAGLIFHVVPPQLDEKAAKRDLDRQGVSPPDQAQALARLKGAEVSARFPQDLVLAADQVLIHRHHRLDRAANLQAAEQQLFKLAGDRHDLITAFCLWQARACIFSGQEQATLVMRSLSAPKIARYVQSLGAAALETVGCYALEGRGLQLMESIAGDYFTILGLPMLPLLSALRSLGFEACFSLVPSENAHSKNAPSENVPSKNAHSEK